jgi:hypothetical protein
LAVVGTERFRWGVNIDDMWRYAGVPPPKSIIIPYVLSLRLPRGPVRIPPDVKSLGTPNSNHSNQSSDFESGDRKQFSSDIASELKSRGIQFVRCWFQWNFFEPVLTDLKDPKYLFPLDDFVSLLNQSGIEIIAVIGNGYSRFLPQGINMEDSQGYLQRLDSVCRAIVRHYKDSIKIWQIENEPNWWSEHYATHWRSGGLWLEPGIQEDILQTMNTLVREEDPSARIVINLEADERKTNWSFYQKYCDVLGLDFYPNYLHSTPINASELRFSSEVKKQTGLPVFIAETGYPSGPSIFGYSEERQAEYIRSACEESFACDEIFALSIWRMSDSYWKSFPEQENHFGLFAKDGSPKIAWGEYCNQVKEKH